MGTSVGRWVDMGACRTSLIITLICSVKEEASLRPDRKYKESRAV